MLKFVSVTESSNTCANCGRPLQTEYCGSCGQKRFDASQLTLRHFAKAAVAEVSDFENSKLLRSLRLLFSRPGFLTNEWLNGRRKSYVAPLKLFLLSFALMFFSLTAYQPVAIYDLRTAIATDKTGVYQKGVDRVAAKRALPASVVVERITEKWQAYTSAIQITNVLFFAVLLQTVYLFSNRLFVAHLVFACHFVAFLFFTGVIFWPVYLVVGVKFSTANLVVNLLYVVISALYLFVAIRTVHRQSLPWSIIKALALCLGSWMILSILTVGTLVLAYLRVYFGA